MSDRGYSHPTPVQVQAIPLILKGRDLLAGAQTGTGKTAAFVLPMLERLHASRASGPRTVRVLVVVPTRELALQVEQSIRTYGAYRPSRSTAICQRYQPNIAMQNLGRIKLDRLGPAVAAIFPIWDKCNRYTPAHSQPLVKLGVRPSVDELCADWLALQSALAAYTAD